MDRSLLTLIFLMLACAAEVWSLAIKTNEERNDMKQSKADENGDDNGNRQESDSADLQRRYAMLLDSMPNNHPFGFAIKDNMPNNHPFGFAIRDSLPDKHPFGFAISRGNSFLGKKKRDYFPRYVQSRAFHGKRNFDSDDDSDDQNTSVFHGKRSGDLISDWLLENSRDNPRVQTTSGIFHGKKGMDEFMQYLLKDLDNESTQVKK